MHEDTRLIRRLKRGDKQALRRLYEKYKDKLVTVAASLLNEEDAAEDILHDVFVSFAAGVKGYRLHGSLKNYLITCVINRVRDSYRRKQYQVIEVRRLRRTGSNATRPEQQLVLGEETQLVTDALAQIPFEQREVIVLHLRAGMKFREIAAAQRVPISTVQARYRYGLDKLKSIINGEMIR